MPSLLAIDQGTTSSRAMLFGTDGAVLAEAREPLAAAYPAPGWVEQDGEELWRGVLACCRRAMSGHAPPAGIGITNQRETVLVWERASGRCLHPAIVWQDRRTADVCRSLAAGGMEPLVQQRTGLLLDPYFSATKLAWILDHVPGARTRAEAGELAAGTVDSFLLWRLSGGRVHATDVTNASRTLLFDIHAQRWDAELCRLLRIPQALLPAVRDCAADYGTTEPTLLGAAIPLRGVAGDQQAAAIGQGCLAPGMAKCTFGTGCFALLSTGERALGSRNRLLTTPILRLRGRTTYGLEGSVFNAGTVVQFLRDNLRALDDSAASAAIAASVPDSGGVRLVPAFTGLGAPWWDPEARGAILGLTRDTTLAHIVRAGLESVALQVADLVAAMRDDGAAPRAMRVDGGMAANDWLMQLVADLLDLPVERPALTETTAWGAAWLAGVQAGLFAEDAPPPWRLARTFAPALPAQRRERMRADWQTAVRRVLTR